MNGRKSNGQFERGHHLFGKSNRIKNGRKKTIAGQVRDALQIAEDAMPDIIEAMIKRAKGEMDVSSQVQQDAAEYLIDRIYGKPRQSLEHTGRAGGPLEVVIKYAIKGGVNGT